MAAVAATSDTPAEERAVPAPSAPSSSNTTDVPPKPVPVELDLGSLAATDANLLAPELLAELAKPATAALTCPREALLTALARDSAQLLLNALFALPVSGSLDGVFVSLPAATTPLPRYLPVPKDKPLTRWERFAKAKGIQKKKTSRMVYDEEQGRYRPSWGYDQERAASGAVAEDWLLELPGNADPLEDQYAKAREAKQDRVAKNKQQAKRNTEEAQAQLEGRNVRAVRKQQLERQVLESKAATASMGKFDRTLKGEKDIKVKRTEKRKFAPAIGDTSAEMSSSVELANKMLKGGDKAQGEVNVKKAVRALHQTADGDQRLMSAKSRKTANHLKKKARK